MKLTESPGRRHLAPDLVRKSRSQGSFRCLPVFVRLGDLASRPVLPSAVSTARKGTNSIWPRECRKRLVTAVYIHELETLHCFKLRGAKLILIHLFKLFLSKPGTVFTRPDEFRRSTCGLPQSSSLGRLVPHSLTQALALGIRNKDFDHSKRRRFQTDCRETRGDKVGCHKTLSSLCPYTSALIALQLSATSAKTTEREINSQGILGLKVVKALAEITVTLCQAIWNGNGMSSTPLLPHQNGLQVSKKLVDSRPSGGCTHSATEAISGRRT